MTSTTLAAARLKLAKVERAWGEVLRAERDALQIPQERAVVASEEREG